MDSTARAETCPSHGVPQLGLRRGLRSLARGCFLLTRGRSTGAEVIFKEWLQTGNKSRGEVG